MPLVDGHQLINPEWINPLINEWISHRKRKQDGQRRRPISYGHVGGASISFTSSSSSIYFCDEPVTWHRHLWPRSSHLTTDQLNLISAERSSGLWWIHCPHSTQIRPRGFLTFDLSSRPFFKVENWSTLGLVWMKPTDRCRLNPAVVLILIWLEWTRR